MQGVNKTGAVSCGSHKSVLAGAWMSLLAATGVLFVGLALCGALTCMCPSVAYAADAANSNANYTYTVRVFAGNQGTVDGGDCKVYANIPVGARWSFHPEMVRIDDDSKYYVKGIKLAGRDNDTARAVMNTSSFVVNEDIDLVVAYGVKGSVTYYTVTYVDENGRELAPTQRYEGNVGDRPVVAYRYIEGYRPQAYNLSGTLSEDESNNAFTFVYTPVAAGEEEGGAAVGAAGAGAGAAGATDAAGQGNQDVAGVAAGQGSQDGAVEQNPAPTTDISEDGVPLAGAPEEIVSIDDNEVPLAAGIVDGNSQVLRGLSSPIGMAVACLVIVIIGAVAWRFIVMYKRSRGVDREG